MKFYPLLAFTALTLFTIRNAAAQDQRENAQPKELCEPPAAASSAAESTEARLLRLIDTEKAEIANPRDARELLQFFIESMKSKPTEAAKCLNLVPTVPPCSTLDTANVDSEDFYAFIHILKWSKQSTEAAPLPPGGAQGGSPAPTDAVGSPVSSTNSAEPTSSAFQPTAAEAPAGSTPGAAATTENQTGTILPAIGGTQSIEKQNWYVYHSGKWSQRDFVTRKHLAGARHVWLLYVHLDGQTPYVVRYPVDITKIVPAPWQNLRALGELAVGGIAEAAGFNAGWGGACIPIDFVPSTLTIAPTFTKVSPTVTAKTEPLGDAQTFDNEGPYRFDFSVGVPIRKISELDFSSDNTTVAVKEIDKNKLLALFDYYPVPVDFRRQTYSRFPFLVAGVALTSKPLDHVFLGLGWGTQFLSLYAGVAVVKEERPQTLTPGDNATTEQLDADLKSERKGKFTFGVHLPVRTVRDLLKQKNQS